jgi:hypothetical protein
VCVSYCPSGDPGPWGVWVCSLGALIGGRPPCELARVARGRPWHGLMRLRAAKAMEELKQVLGEVSFVGWAAHGSVPCGHRGWVRPPPCQSTLSPNGQQRRLGRTGHTCCHPGELCLCGLSGRFQVSRLVLTCAPHRLGPQSFHLRNGGGNRNFLGLKLFSEPPVPARAA